MYLRREQVAALFVQQAKTLRVEIKQQRHGFLYVLEVDTVGYLACVLSASKDYYEHRLNIHGTHISMLIVGKHDTRVALPVLALDEGYFYAPLEAPRWYKADRVRTRKDAMVVVGGLLSGVEEAYQQVEAMKRSTRYQYLARMRSYLTGKQGRQLAV